MNYPFPSHITIGFERDDPLIKVLEKIANALDVLAKADQKRTVSLYVDLTTVEALNEIARSIRGGTK